MRSWARYNPTQYGWMLLAAAALLCLFGVLAVHASERKLAGDGLGYTGRQIAYVGAGLVAMLAVTRIGHRRLGQWSYGIYAFTLVVLAILLVDRFVDLPFVPSDVRETGARRWLRLPQVSFVQVQPSEFAKLAYVMALAWYLRYRKNYRRLVGLIGPFVLTIVPMVLILLEPDLGTVVLLMPILLLMLFAAGAKARHLLAVLAACVLAAPLMFTCVMRDYQKMRVLGPLMQSEGFRQCLQNSDRLRRLTGIQPSDIRRWDFEQGYQLIHSKIALGSGGVGGHGMLGGPYIRYSRFLPDRHNDFIFSVIGNQWGLAGTVALLACFGIIVMVGFEVSTRTDDPFARLLAIGMVALLGVQCLFNVGMTVGLTPITGMTLPLVSFGGSSMVSSFLAIGIVINIAQRRPPTIGHKPFEFDNRTSQ